MSLMRISGMNVFVAFFVLLLLLADCTPPAASSIPLIGEFLSRDARSAKRDIAIVSRPSVRLSVRL